MTDDLSDYIEAMPIMHNNLGTTECDDDIYVRVEDYEELERENAELTKQIEQLKCCGNCKHWGLRKYVKILSYNNVKVWKYGQLHKLGVYKMSERYQKKIRKEISAKYKQMFQQVLNKLESEAKSQNFFQRLKISMKYLFEKKIDLF